MTVRKQRENWQLIQKDSTGFYCLQRMAWGYVPFGSKNPGYHKTFTVSIFFDKINEYDTRYELLRMGVPIAIIHKAVTRINGLQDIDPDDIIKITKP